MLTSGADFQTRYAETQTILSNLTNTKQSTGREDNDDAKMLSMTTTTCGNVVSQQCKLVSDAQHLVRGDIPSSTLSSTNGEVAYLTGTRAPTYVGRNPFSPSCAPALRPF